MAKSAIKGHQGVNVEGYRDYRGQEVLGAWLWDEELGIGLATEIDALEAKAVYYMARNLILFLMGLTIFISLVGAYVLIKKNVRLREAIIARDEFLSVASHELNTPLTSLMIMIHLINKYIIEQKLDQVPLERLEELVKISDIQLRRFSSLINSMLDVSRIRTGRLILNASRVQLSPLIHNAVEEIQYQSNESNHEIKLDLDDAIVGQWDQLRIKQVILHLLNNAIKFSTDRPIKIKTTQNEDKATIIVKDHGIGIPKEVQSRILKEFERSASIKAYGGLGLGLFIANQIIIAHQGVICLESEAGKGTTVYVELPLNSKIGQKI